jgi:hypothetical protein
LDNAVGYNNHPSSTSFHEIGTLSTPSVCSDIDLDTDLNDMDDLVSEISTRAIRSLASINTSQNGDKLQKSFLQLKGIIVGNFYMGGNFHISAALQIMIQYNITILAIKNILQPLDGEITSIE